MLVFLATGESSKQSVGKLCVPVKSVSNCFILNLLSSCLGHWYCADTEEQYNLIIKIQRKLI